MTSIYKIITECNIGPQIQNKLSKIIGSNQKTKFDTDFPTIIDSRRLRPFWSIF